MFGNTYPIMGGGRTVSERLGNSGLADFVRLEFRPADQSSVIFALRRAGRAERRRRTAEGLLHRFRSWRAAIEARREGATVGH